METKKNILEMAFRLFLKDGFRAVSLNEVIREANVTKGCFYHYFKSKEDLIHNVIIVYLYDYLKSPIEAFENWIKQHKSVDIMEALHFCYTFMPELTLKTGEKIAFRDIQFLIYEGIKYYHYLAQESCDCSRKQRLLFQKLLEKAKEEDLIEKNIDTQEYATTIMAVRDGMIALHILDSSIDTKQKWESTFLAICEKMKAKKREQTYHNEGDLYAETTV